VCGMRLRDHVISLAPFPRCQRCRSTSWIRERSYEWRYGHAPEAVLEGEVYLILLFACCRASKGGSFAPGLDSTDISLLFSQAICRLGGLPTMLPADFSCVYSSYLFD
jgi:hypothetical protein